MTLQTMTKSFSPTKTTMTRSSSTRTCMHSHGFALVVRSSFPSSEAASEHMFCIRRVMNHVLLWCDDCSHASASSLLIMTAAFFLMSHYILLVHADMHTYIL